MHEHAWEAKVLFTRDAKQPGRVVGSSFLLIKCRSCEDTRVLIGDELAVG